MLCCVISAFFLHGVYFRFRYHPRVFVQSTYTRAFRYVCIARVFTVENHSATRFVRALWTRLPSARYPGRYQAFSCAVRARLHARFSLLAGNVFEGVHPLGAYV